MPYPPSIDDPVTFPAPPPMGVVGSCPLSIQQCGITTFGLTGHPGNGTSFAAPPAAPLVAGAQGRYVFAPGVETFAASWTLAGAARIVRLKLELYRRGSALLEWSKQLDYSAAPPVANGSTQLNGDLQVGTHAASVPASVVTIVQPGIARYPRDVLTAEHAPYKLVLRITQTLPNTEVTCAAQWIYLDVMVHDIELALAPNPWIPPAGPAFRQARHHRLTTATCTDLRGQLDAASRLSGATAPAAARVRLTTHVFSKTSRDFYSNTIFTGIQRVWGDGPTLPLQATVRIRRSDGNPAATQAGAPALGNLGVLWDWVSDARPAHPDAGADAYITAAQGYRSTDWPHAVANCHADHGGKRGGAAPRPHFGALPAGSLAAPALVLTPVANRPWSTITRPVTDGADVDAGKAGVVFMPSRIAGDTYRLRAYLAFPNDAAFDVGANAALDTAAASSVHVASPTVLTVWRRVEVAHQWRKNGGVDAASLHWGQVSGFLAGACVELVPPGGPQNLVPLDYQTAFTQVHGVLPVGVQLALDVAVNQPNGDFGLHFVDYATYHAAVTVHMGAIRGHFTALPAYPSDDAFRAAQLAHLGVNRPGGYHLEDLIIPTRGDLAGSTAQLTTLVLTTLGVTDQPTYEAKVKGWGDDVLQKVCGAHARAQSTDEPGIHLYQFEFVDDRFNQNDVAEASTSMSNFDPCPDPACAQATPADPPPIHWGDIDDSFKICANCDLRHDESAQVTSFVPFRYMNGNNDAWSQANLSFMQRAKITAGGQFGTTAAISIAHEIGHQLGMPHAGPNAHLGLITIMRTGGIYPVFHDADDDACIMSYNFTEAARLHFCGVCSLRLAGWSMGPSDPMQHVHDAVVDQHTVPLANRAAHVRAQSPPPGATWQADPPNCFGCAAAFGLLRRRHHCRMCGQVFCDACSNNHQPVRDPLVENSVSNERVCDTCNGFGGAPLDRYPTAIWDPDDNSSVCHHGGCNTRFSTTEHRHHCRACGHIFCAAHSSHQRLVRRPLEAAGQVSIERVCNACNATY